MKLYIIATTLLFATATVSCKKYIVSYPNDTKQPVVDENAQVLEQKGCKILHKYSELSPASSIGVRSANHLSSLS